MKSPFPHKKNSFFAFFFILILFIASCVSHLRDAKLHYTEGEKYSRRYQTDKAFASFKKAIQEAELVAKKNPHAQAYMVKGLAELRLELWEDAEESFAAAFALGFEEGEEWASQISLFGLASSFEELGLEESASNIYSHLLGRSKLKPISSVVAQKYIDLNLKNALQEEGSERNRMLTQLLRTAERLTSSEMSYGFYHYLQSQIFSHLSEYRQSFEQAVMARELGLPTLEISRDNDMQIIFCFNSLKEKLSSQEWGEFHSIYLQWIKRWDWKGPQSPDWKRE
jgi:tetratricopeptide (TPR) repeat protein